MFAGIWVCTVYSYALCCPSRPCNCCQRYEVVSTIIGGVQAPSLRQDKQPVTQAGTSAPIRRCRHTYRRRREPRLTHSTSLVFYRITGHHNSGQESAILLLVIV